KDASVDLGGHAPVVACIVNPVPESAQQALTASLINALEGGRVAGERVRWCERADQDAGGESRQFDPVPILAPALQIVDEPAHGAAPRQVELSQPPVIRVLVPGWIGEAAIPGSGSH